MRRVQGSGVGGSRWVCLCTVYWVRLAAAFVLHKVARPARCEFPHAATPCLRSHGMPRPRINANAGRLVPEERGVPVRVPPSPVVNTHARAPSLEFFRVVPTWTAEPVTTSRRVFRHCYRVARTARARGQRRPCRGRCGERRRAAVERTKGDRERERRGRRGRGVST